MQIKLPMDPCPLFKHEAQEMRLSHWQPGAPPHRFRCFSAGRLISPTALDKRPLPWNLSTSTTLVSPPTQNTGPTHSCCSSTASRKGSPEPMVK